MDDGKPIRKTDETYRRALDSLTRYLAARDHSRLELRQKLMRRFEAALVDKLLDEADERGWLLAEETMAERAAASLRRKNKSGRYIAGQLRKRGLPGVARDSDAELEAARALVERKFGGEGKLSFEDKARATRYLKYRGFDDRAIRQVLNEER